MEQIESTALVQVYQVTVETEKGVEIIKTTVNQQTNVVEVIEQRPLIAPAPEPLIPFVPAVNPFAYETNIVVDSVTGVKTTFTTDVTVIKQD